MSEDPMKQRKAYVELKTRRPDLFEKAVQIGSLVLVDSGDSLRKAAKVEGAVVGLLLKVLDEDQSP